MKGKIDLKEIFRNANIKTAKDINFYRAIAVRVLYKLHCDKRNRCTHEKWHARFSTRLADHEPHFLRKQILKDFIAFYASVLFQVSVSAYWHQNMTRNKTFRRVSSSKRNSGRTPVATATLKKKIYSKSRILRDKTNKKDTSKTEMLWKLLEQSVTQI